MKIPLRTRVRFNKPTDDTCIGFAGIGIINGYAPTGGCGDTDEDPMHNVVDLQGNDLGQFWAEELATIEWPVGTRVKNTTADLAPEWCERGMLGTIIEAWMEEDAPQYLVRFDGHEGDDEDNLVGFTHDELTLAEEAL